MASAGEVRGRPESARALAAHALARVWGSEGYAAPILDAALRRAPGIDPRDAALATELVYGVLRVQPFLEERIGALAKSKRWAADPEVRAHMLIGAYSICFLDRIPAFAAVSEAVSAIRAARGQKASGFANAVLRRMAGEVRGAEGAAGGEAPSLAAAVVASAPGWLRGALRRSLGRAGAEAFLTAGVGSAEHALAPPAGLCLAPGEDREAWIARLREAAPGASIEAGRVSPPAILVRGAGDARRLPGHDEAWIGQEEGAQVIALALGARPGERVLDACAGRGNKTWLLAREVGAGGAVDAADLYAAKIARAAEAGARAVHAVDWTVGPGEVPEGFDRVLVDAPCSGVGTLRRRPEIGLRRTAEDVARLAELQVAITRRAATRAREGGVLVFAVCSVLREEAEEVVARLTADPGAGDPEVRLEAAAFDAEIARGLAGGGSCFRLLPHVHGTDGYFAASFVVRRR
ncbi:MAG: Sun protein [Polyangiaceae bacterium]|nr:Sun protein [Polyangiaceae bacterium]